MFVYKWNVIKAVYQSVCNGAIKWSHGKNRELWT